jgi:hypothetical protein
LLSSSSHFEYSNFSFAFHSSFSSLLFIIFLYYILKLFGLYNTTIPVVVGVVDAGVGTWFYFISIYSSLLFVAVNSYLFSPYYAVLGSSRTLQAHCVDAVLLNSTPSPAKNQQHVVLHIIYPCSNFGQFF